MALSFGRRKFVQEYLIDCNASAAAIRSGYSEDTSRQAGHKLMQDPEVIAAIEEGQRHAAERAQVTADKVIAELAKLAFSNMADYLVTDENGAPSLNLSTLTRDQFAAVVEVTVGPRGTKFKLADKRAALADLCRHLGLMVDRHEHSGPDGKSLPAPQLVVSPEVIKGIAKELHDAV